MRFNQDLEYIAKAFSTISKKKDIMDFIKDIMTPREISAISSRLKVACILAEEKYSVNEIHAITKVSPAIICRISRVLRMESSGGYKIVINKLKENIEDSK